jgi:hypothetical protein
MGLLEGELRAFIYDAVRFLRRRVPGFEQARLLFVSPFVGARGGPRIEGAYVLTPLDLHEGRLFDDTLFRSYVGLRQKGAERGCDMPYRLLLPQGVAGLLVTGRGMSYKRRGHDPAVRARCNMMMLGQAAGVAAAFAAADGVCPRELPIRRLQRAMLEEGYFLGDETRLRELGLA